MEEKKKTPNENEIWVRPTGRKSLVVCKGKVGDDVLGVAEIDEYYVIAVNVEAEKGELIYDLNPGPLKLSERDSQKDPSTAIKCQIGSLNRVTERELELMRERGVMVTILPAVNLSRQEMINKLLWSRGGYGFGVCSFVNSAIWANDAPGPDRPDFVSIVAIGGSPDKYTDEELLKLVMFSERTIARYDRTFSYRRGANLVIFDKLENGSWLRKRLTWNQGPMFSATLDEAIMVMEGPQYF